jgi:hypothetical protein
MNIKIAFALTCLLATFNATAQPLFFTKNTNAAINTHDLSAPIVTVHVLVYHPYTSEFSEQHFIGTSASAPCSDLKAITQNDMTNITGYVTASNFKLTSAKIISEFGSALTCIRADVTMANNNHVYTSGNIQLMWNNTSSTYTSAIPSTITMDINAV